MHTCVCAHGKMEQNICNSPLSNLHVDHCWCTVQYSQEDNTSNYSREKDEKTLILGTGLHHYGAWEIIKYPRIWSGRTREVVGRAQFSLNNSQWYNSVNPVGWESRIPQGKSWNTNTPEPRFPLSVNKRRHSSSRRQRIHLSSTPLFSLFTRWLLPKLRTDFPLSVGPLTYRPASSRSTLKDRSKTMLQPPKSSRIKPNPQWITTLHHLI